MIKKIASDVYDDWGLQAIHLVNVQSKGRKPIVAVIDSGGKLPNENMLTGYNAINNTTDVTDATGNDGLEELPFPANMSFVISVIARDINNVDVAFSNVSSCKKSVSAPGVHLRTEDGFKSGTSFAAAFVTGTVSLMKSARENLDVKTIQTILDGHRRTGTISRMDLFKWIKWLLKQRKRQILHTYEAEISHERIFLRMMWVGFFYDSNRA